MTRSWEENRGKGAVVGKVAGNITVVERAVTVGRRGRRGNCAE